MKQFRKLNKNRINLKKSKERLRKRFKEIKTIINSNKIFIKLKQID